MTTIAEISIPTTEFALAETDERLPDLTASIETIAADDPDRTLSLCWFSAVTRRDLETALGRDQSVTSFDRVLEGADDRNWLYRIHFAEAVHGHCRVLFEHDGAVLSAAIGNGQWTMRLLFPRRDALSDAVSALERRDVVVDVRRLVEADGNGDLDVSAALTDPQQEAIAEAYKHGYYDVPREISLEDLARELDISHQALSERLRRANRVLAGKQLGNGQPERATE